MTRYAPHAVIAVFGVMLVVATVLTLQRHTTRVIGSNGVAPAAFVVTVPSGASACQTVPPAPSATRAIRMTLGVYHDPSSRVRADAGTATSGRVVRGLDGVRELPLADAAGNARVCVTNVGPHKLELAGSAATPGSGATVDGRPAAGVFAVTFLQGPAGTWSDRVGDVLARVGYAKGAEAARRPARSCSCC